MPAGFLLVQMARHEIFMLQEARLVKCQENITYNKHFDNEINCLEKWKDFVFYMNAITFWMLQFDFLVQNTKLDLIA